MIRKGLGCALLCILLLGATGTAGVLAAETTEMPGLLILDEVGTPEADIITIETNQYAILTEPVGSQPGTVSLRDCNEETEELIIPSTITQNGKTYTVTEIELGYQYGGMEFYNMRRMEIPETVTAIHHSWTFEANPLESITFHCPVSALADLRGIHITEKGINSIIYVPSDEVELYREKFNSPYSGLSILDCSDLNSRGGYQGLNVAAIGAADIMPVYFSDKGLYYEVISQEDMTVKLIGGVNHVADKEGAGFELPSSASYGDKVFTVTTLGSRCLAEVSVPIIMPDTIIAMEDLVFSCDIPAIYFSNSLKDLPKLYMFNGENESKAVYVKLPQKLKKIRKNAFVDYYSLKGLVIPKKVKSIGAGAFPESLETLYLPGEIPNNFDQAVKNVKQMTLYVKKSQINKANEILKEAIKEKKVVVKKGNFKKQTSITLNKHELVAGEKETYNFKVSLSDAKKGYQLIWGTNEYKSSLTQDGLFEKISSGGIYSNSAVYVFDLLSGQYDFCQLISE